jgi:hypothetical protein
MMLLTRFFGVFCDYDFGDVCAWFSYFFDCFGALHLIFEYFLGREGLLQGWRIKDKGS